MTNNVTAVLNLTKELQNSFTDLFHPPETGYHSPTQRVIADSIVRQTRGYIERIANQINGCFENGWYDACAVMMRRLLETVIIEVFEAHAIASKIKNPQGDYFYLNDLISAILAESNVTLSRNTRDSLKKLKKVGDLSAHSRRYNANYQDIEGVRYDFRIAIEELLYLARLK